MDNNQLLTDLGFAGKITVKVSGDRVDSEVFVNSLVQSVEDKYQYKITDLQDEINALREALNEVSAVNRALRKKIDQINLVLSGD
jgi:restriction endonuclease